MYKESRRTKRYKGRAYKKHKRSQLAFELGQAIINVIGKYDIEDVKIEKSREERTLLDVCIAFYEKEREEELYRQYLLSTMEEEQHGKSDNATNIKKGY